MKIVLFSLCLFFTTSLAYAGSSTAQLERSWENPQSSAVQWQGKMAQRYADTPINLWMAYEPRQDLPRDRAALGKLEQIRKTISAIGVAIFIPLALFFGLLGGGAFSKTLISEERKKTLNG